MPSRSASSPQQINAGEQSVIMATSSAVAAAHKVEHDQACHDGKIKRNPVDAVVT
jgi:hypothetical protein